MLHLLASAVSQSALGTGGSDVGIRRLLPHLQHALSAPCGTTEEQAVGKAGGRRGL